MTIIIGSDVDGKRLKELIKDYWKTTIMMF